MSVGSAPETHAGGFAIPRRGGHARLAERNFWILPVGVFGNFWILPVGVFGNSVALSTYRPMATSSDTAEMCLN